MKFYHLALRTLVLLLVTFFSNPVNLHADANSLYDDESLDLLEQIIRDKGEGWLCEWEVLMPDGLPSLTAKNNFVGIRNISEVGYDTEEEPGPILLLYDRILVKDFMGKYDLPIRLGLEGQILNYEPARINYWIGYDENEGLSGFISQIASKPTVNNYYMYVYDTQLNQDSQNDNIVFYLDAKVIDENTLQLSVSNDYGLLIIKNWNKTPISKSKPENFEMVYAAGLNFRFFRKESAGVATATISYSLPSAGNFAANRSYPVLWNEVNGSLETTNLFGRGREYFGNVLGFSIKSYSLPTAETVTLSDGEPFPFSTIGSLSLSPLLSVYNENNYKFSEYAGDDINDLRYEDYVIVSEDAYSELAADIESKLFWNIYQRILASDEASRYARPLVKLNVAKNSHWDRPEEVAAVSSPSISIEPHYLVPIKYIFNDLFGDKEVTSTNITRHFKIENAPIKVDELSINLPTKESESLNQTFLDFTLNAYGNGPIDDGTDNHFIYIAGTLSTDAQTSTLYIVPGTISDYASSSLSDTDAGHKDGLCIETYRVIASDSDILRPLSEADSGTNLEYLIPKSTITTSADETYTLYAKYTDTGDDTSRFRTLVTLSPLDVTTGVDDAKVNDERAPFTLVGNTLTANVQQLDIYDFFGRALFKLQRNQSAVLQKGIYLIRKSEGAAHRKILVP